MSFFNVYSHSLSPPLCDEDVDCSILDFMMFPDVFVPQNQVSIFPGSELYRPDVFCSRCVSTAVFYTLFVLKALFIGDLAVVFVKYAAFCPTS